MTSGLATSVDTDTAGSAPRPRRRFRTAATRFFVAVGVLATGATLAGAAVDIATFDRTRGGYEAPYTGWTGTPIDWSAGDVTDEGFRDRGYVIDTLLDCTTGMIGFEAFGLTVDFRPVSARAIVVHRPREACAEEGFTPRF